MQKILIKSTLISKIVNSKKDFLFYNVDNENKLIDYILTNDFKYKNKYKGFRVVSTIQSEHEFIKL
jgi:hypothetical protein